MRRGDVEVYVSVDDSRLEEYGVVVDGPRRASSCWIASEEGKEFAVIVKNSSCLFAYVVKLFVDGREMDYAVVQLGVAKWLGGTYISASELRPYRFVPLTLTSEDEAEVLASLYPTAPVDLESLGTIEVHGWRVACGKTREWKNIDFDQHEIGAISERSKKAASHVVALGDKKPATKAQTVDIKYIDSPDTPGVLFRFQYRSRDLLQAQGIIPRQRPTQAVLNVPHRGPAPLPSFGPPLRLPHEPPEWLTPSSSSAGPSRMPPSELDRVQRWREGSHREINEAPRHPPNPSPSESEQIRKRLETINTEMSMLYDRLREAESRRVHVSNQQARHEIRRSQPKSNGKREVIDLTLDSDGE